ncbi:hypothetical protein [Mucilaginibacter sp.]|jgi:hypothetical protein|uniref:hypothetical protein n=1 Tax=Mucilaginibacter sp. TaxID=1882438 RepID=UPI002CB98F2B|nr:hypothetical protein [Mucilaginibacter sp.]HTI59098.1 hypothetical protein [Mucilaginibacter sp.]
MKPLNKIVAALLSIALLVTGYDGFSQGAQKGDLSVNISYFNINNQIPYVSVNVKSKINGRFQPIGGIPLKLFLDKDTAGTFIGQVVTNEKGAAWANIPSSVKKEWNSSVSHTFLATFDGNKQYEPAKADVTVGRAIVTIKVTDDKNITATVLEMKGESWVPVKGVDLKVAVRRLGGDLPVNETPTFTTDSTGQASADFKRDSIPGDAKGNITLVVKMEDNDQFGNVSAEKVVPWGSKFVYKSTFNERTLFATRDKAPIWLQLIAYSIIVTVWGILIYLVFNILKIRKLGKSI